MLGESQVRQTHVWKESTQGWSDTMGRALNPSANPDLIFRTLYIPLNPPGVILEQLTQVPSLPYHEVPQTPPGETQRGRSKE